MPSRVALPSCTKFPTATWVLWSSSVCQRDSGWHKGGGKRRGGSRRRGRTGECQACSSAPGQTPASFLFRCPGDHQKRALGPCPPSSLLAQELEASILARKGEKMHQRKNKEKSHTDTGLASSSLGGGAPAHGHPRVLAGLPQRPPGTNEGRGSCLADQSPSFWALGPSHRRGSRGPSPGSAAVLVIFAHHPLDVEELLPQGFGLHFLPLVVRRLAQGRAEETLCKQSWCQPAAPPPQRLGKISPSRVLDYSSIIPSPDSGSPRQEIFGASMPSPGVPKAQPGGSFRCPKVGPEWASSSCGWTLGRCGSFPTGSFEGEAGRPPVRSGVQGPLLGQRGVGLDDPRGPF